MQLAVACTLLATLGLGAPSAKAAGIYDNMEYLAKHAPPAIVHLRDRAVRLLYAQEVLNLWDRFNCLSYRLKSEYGGCFFDNVIVDSTSRNTEPALHLLVTTSNRRHGGVTSVPPREDVHHMRAFADGLNKWYTKGYNRTTLRAIRAAKSHFLHSIAYAAFVTNTGTVRCAKKVGNTCLEYEDPINKAQAQAMAQQYLKSGWAGNRDVLSRMERAFEEMGNGNIKSTDPFDPYNRKLTAAWAAEYLVDHYWILVEHDPDSVETRDGKHLGHLVTDYIGVPLIDPVGYNIAPFKGQPNFFGKIRKGVGYTERTYFERQRTRPKARAPQAAKNAATPRHGTERNPAADDAGVDLSRSQRKLVQLGLTVAGFAPGPADGIFGRRTRKAIREWQSSRGEPATGDLTAAAAEALVQAGNTAPSTKGMEGAREILAEAARAAQGEKVTTNRAWAFAKIAMVQTKAGDTRGAAQSFSDARATAQGEKSRSSRAWAFARIATGQLKAGDARGAAQSLSDARAAAREDKYEYTRAWVFTDIAAGAAQGRDAHGTAQSLSDARAAAQETEGEDARAWAFAHIAETQLKAGDTRGAAQSLSDARDAARGEEKERALRRYICPHRGGAAQDRGRARRGAVSLRCPCRRAGGGKQNSFASVCLSRSPRCNSRPGTRAARRSLSPMPVPPARGEEDGSRRAVAHVKIAEAQAQGRGRARCRAVLSPMPAPPPGGRKTDPGAPMHLPA